MVNRVNRHRMREYREECAQVKDREGGMERVKEEGVREGGRKEVERE